MNHGAALRLVSENDNYEQLIKDFRAANISNRELKMLEYAEKLTIDSSNITKEDITTLKEASFSDKDIFDINQVTAYFNYVNRIADGLGVELEE